jgi:hypothetical protein
VTTAAPSAVAAAGNSLSNGSVSPSSGTTDTIFQFSVSYSSPQGFAAMAVIVHVANQIIDMVLVAGTDEDGVYQTAAQLPEGSWAVTFEASATQGRSPTLAGPTVTVASVAVPAPPSTPAPVPVVPVPPAQPPVTPVPPPVAPAAPAEVPTDPASDAAPLSASPSNGASAADIVVGTPGGVSLPAELVDQATPWTLAGAAIGAISIFALALGGFAVARRRRASEAQPMPANSGIVSAPPIATTLPTRRLADWELSALDDEPIGTVEYLGRQP